MGENWRSIGFTLLVRQGNQIKQTMLWSNPGWHVEQEIHLNIVWFQSGWDGGILNSFWSYYTRDFIYVYIVEIKPLKELLSYHIPEDG